MEFVRHAKPCIHNSENYVFLWDVLRSCILTLVYQLIFKSMRAFVYRCLLLLWSVKPFHSGWLGETNSSTSSIFRIGSKQLYSADQILIQFLFCSTLECYHLYIKLIMGMAHHPMNSWFSDTLAIIIHSSVSCCRNQNANKWIVMCEFNTPSNLVAW